MANVIKKTTNRFIRGLIMDFSPENTKNEVLSNALNATLLTFNGNELSLQNDMGNARVETAYLPEGYMPVGTCEYGGIIYIVSYNPLEDKSLIGCFPSPERNISSDELGHLTNPISYELFLDIITGEIKQASYSVLLKLDNLNPGDKFIITSNNTIYLEKIKDLYKKNAEDNFILQENPIIALNIVSIEDNGKIVYLNSDVRQYEVIREITEGDSKENKTFRYSILGSEKEGTSITKLDIDSYRNAVSSGYSVFRSKVSGKLAILAELIMIDSYSVTHSIKAKPESDTEFDIIIHTDVSPKLNSKNYLYEPKLKYYYLSNSQGYMQTVDDNGEGIKFPLFGNDNSISSFYKINLKNIYSSNNSQLFDVTLKDVSEFKFPVSNTYHGRLTSFNGNNYSGNDIYTKFFKNNYHKINVNQIKDSSGYFYNTLQATVYEYESGGNSKEIPYTNPVLNELYTYYVKTSNSEYVDVERNTDYKTEILYEIVTTPAIATENIIKDKSIEKFLYQQILYYKRATLKDLASGKILYYRENGENGEILYKQLIGELDENALYYVYETESTLVSIGYEVTVVNSLNIYYYTGIKTYYTVSDDKKNIYYDFDRYPKDENSPSLGAPFNLYRIVENESFREATEEELLLYNNDSTSIALYYIENYKKVLQSDIDNSISEDSILFIVFPQDEIITKNYFIPSQEFNYIKGTTSVDTYPKNDPIEVLTIADFMPELDSENNDKYNYNDVKLASIKIPDVVINNGLDLPFKYDYTIVPCMNYGRLDHLAVSNTIDFGKLHAFNQSEFHTWKYYIENGLLRLTFGADVYDTYEKSKVDGIILEFYDLWGYAGTLEITDKKSYSGVFTKIIPLNTINALSNKKIIKDQDNNLKYSNEEYVRNIEIIDNEGIYKYKNLEVEHNTITGWKFKNSSDKIDNDCSTLYPNLIYGVKAYFRRKTTGDNYEFIPKKDFFLYTLPIFNEYYSSLQNFDIIENPELKFTLTYKLLDESNRTILNNDNIINGYNQEDYNNIASYLNGTYLSADNILKVTKYYNYIGISKLLLAIGLSEEYKNLNLFSDTDLDNYYKCKLQLVSDNDINKTFSIKDNNFEISNSSILNYEDLEINNSLAFANGKDIFESLKGIADYDYLLDKSEFISINYNFTVGYKAKISDITLTQIPATTICALYHMKPDGSYNYEDFGIYKKDGRFYSETMIYTSGDEYTSILGLCKQINSTGKVYEQCLNTISFETPSKFIDRPGLLHTGKNLENICKYLKKLAFYLPHVHGSVENIDPFYCPNLDKEEGKNYFVLPDSSQAGKGIGDHHDDAYGNYPSTIYSINPLYTFIPNTENTIEFLSEFYSAYDYIGTSECGILLFDKQAYSEPHYSGVSSKLRKFRGFIGEELLDFNEKLLTTMSSIYGYNPDYNTLNVNVGNIILLNYSPIFTSNLINKFSEFNFNDSKILNDYIYIGGVSISNYLNELYEHSAIEIKKEEKGSLLAQINFTANFENCGTNENPVLLSSLTYKTSIPEELTNELTFNDSLYLVVKHHDGSILKINGILNKKALYGYDPEFKNLVVLDVSNYTIGYDGTLTLNYMKYLEPVPDTVTLSNKIWSDKYIITDKYKVLNYLNIYGYNTDNLIFDTNSNKIYFVLYILENNNSPDNIFEFKPLYNERYKFIINKIDATVNRSVIISYEIAKDQENEKLIQNLELLNLLLLTDLLDGKEDISISGTSYKISDFVEYNTELPENILIYNDKNKLTITQPNISFIGFRIIEFQLLKLEGLLENYSNELNTLIDTIKTENYASYIVDDKTNCLKYKVNKSNVYFRGTSVTINDLVYKPDNDHRLYMKNDLYKYDPSLENKIAYRIRSWLPEDGAGGFQNTNDLFMMTGPCFTPETGI